MQKKKYFFYFYTIERIIYVQKWSLSIIVSIFSHNVTYASVKNLAKENLSAFIKKQAHQLGFAACGIAKAEFLTHHAPKLESWLKAGMHGEMKYMENHFDKRLNPQLLVENARSVIVLLFNYFPETQSFHTDFILSKYAYGVDYHHLIKEKLYQLLDILKTKIGNIHARVFVDSAPVLERAWAAKAGLGWQGKNANLIRKNEGSFFFISEIITDLELDYDSENQKDYCGACTKCMEACPTGAIVAPQSIDARRCISYLTIEWRKEIPIEFNDKMQKHILGCDICMDVCPWNKKAKPHSEKAFQPKTELLRMTNNDWLNLTKTAFNQLFKHTALERTKYEGLMRNIRFVSDAEKT